jgi:predicted nucleic acid-binding protein
MKYYIETTIPSFYYDTRQSLEITSRRHWTRRWWEVQKPTAILVTGYSVIAELALTPGAKHDKALAFARQLPVLPESDEVLEVIEFYAQHKLMPVEIFGDATHLALATIHKCDYLVTWNCKHLANPNKLDHMVRVNWMLGFATPKLVTPIQLLENDENDQTQ